MFSFTTNNKALTFQDNGAFNSFEKLCNQGSNFLESMKQGALVTVTIAIEGGREVLFSTKSE
jgi:hypothetical protein